MMALAGNGTVPFVLAFALFGLLVFGVLRGWFTPHIPVEEENEELDWDFPLDPCYHHDRLVRRRALMRQRDTCHKA